MYLYICICICFFVWFFFLKLIGFFAFVFSWKSANGLKEKLLFRYFSRTLTFTSDEKSCLFFLDCFFIFYFCFTFSVYSDTSYFFLLIYLAFVLADRLWFLLILLLCKVILNVREYEATKTALVLLFLLLWRLCLYVF